MNTKVAVVGCGVSGITSGIALLEAGFRVEIIARDLPPNTTSNVAAAWWFAYLAGPEHKVRIWATKTLARLKSFYSIKQSGVSAMEFTELLQPEDSTPWWGTMCEAGRFLSPEEHPPGYTKAFRGIVPLTDSSRYIPYLIKEFQSKGGTITQKSLVNLETELADFQIIVNCTGVWAGQLVNDLDIHPIRGRAIRLSKPNIQPRCWADTHGPNAPIFIVPRNDDYVIGTTFEHGIWETASDPLATEIILSRAGKIEPSLLDCTIIQECAGLRPGRSEVRVEVEALKDGRRLIHNYGHGGAGYTLSWGCASDVVELVLKEYNGAL